MIKYNYIFTEEELEDQASETEGIRDIADACKQPKTEAQENEDDEYSSQD